MRVAAVETSSPSGPFTTLPLLLEQRSSRASAILTLTVLLPVALALLFPFALLAKHLVQDAAVRNVVAEHPATALQLLIGLAFWGVLFAWPMKRLTDLLQWGRSIEISHDGITVAELGFLGVRTWVAPIESYAGITHNIRASLSGVRHELILAHPDPDRSVLLAVAPRFSQPEIDAATRLFSLAEISSLDLSRTTTGYRQTNTAAPGETMIEARV